MILTVEKMEPQRERQNLDLKRLKRIEKMIIVFTVLLAVASFLSKRPSLRAFDVFAGGVVAFIYFYLLEKTFYGAFSSTAEGQDVGFPPHMAIKIFVLSIVAVVSTLGLLISRICLPIAYLIGFSSMFISILADVFFTWMVATIESKAIKPDR